MSGAPLKSRHWRAYGTLRDDPTATEGEVPVADPDTCEHGETVCLECVDSWSIDWHIRWERLDPETGQPIDKPVSTDPEPMTDEQAAATEETFGHPDGWMIEHHRAAGSSTCRFGPFDSIKEAHEWWITTGRSYGVRPAFIPLYRTVDWTR